MFKSCCCCINLRTGGIILGVLTLLGSLTYLYDAIQTRYWGDFISVLWLPISIILLFGIYQDMPNLLLPYVIFVPVIIILNFLRINPMLDEAEAAAKENGIEFDRNTAATFFYIAAAFGALFSLYFGACIYSLYKSMKESSWRQNGNQHV